MSELAIGFLNDPVLMFIAGAVTGVSLFAVLVTVAFSAESKEALTKGE